MTSARNVSILAAVGDCANVGIDTATRASTAPTVRQDKFNIMDIFFVAHGRGRTLSQTPDCADNRCRDRCRDRCCGAACPLRNQRIHYQTRCFQRRSTLLNNPANTTNDAPLPVIALDALCFVGHELVRPECVLATLAGAIHTADWRGGVASTMPNGTSMLIRGALPAGRPLRPNGIALRRDGSVLLADLGESRGGVFWLLRVAPDGATTLILEDADPAHVDWCEAA